MIKTVTMYSVVCDRCGKTFIDEFNGIVAWLDEGNAKEQAMESEWAEIGDKHYCTDCYEFDEKLDEYVPKKERSKKMKQKLLSIKYRLVALWWFLTRKNYYLLSYNGRVGKTLESTNIVIPAFIEWVRKKHGVPTNHEIIMELKNIGNICRSTDILAYNEIKALIEKLEK